MESLSLVNLGGLIDATVRTVQQSYRGGYEFQVLMKSKESRQITRAPVVEAGERLRELQVIRSEVALLREKLFQACCNFQRDDTSVDLTELNILAFKLRSVEEKREALEKTIAAMLLTRAGE